jgi:2-keto-3-deoxy-L-rhamnonate aldolase RhmA
MQSGQAPAILTGDFNCNPDALPHRILVEAGWADTYHAAGHGDGRDSTFHTLDEARAAVAATRYAPQGTRGACIGVRAQRYGALPWATYAAQANENVLVVLALEGPEALALAPEIIALDGVDVVFVGAFDLSQSLGYPGQPMHPAVTEALAALVERAAPAGCAIGTWAPSAADAATRRAAGVRFLTVATDALLLYHAAAACWHDLA